MPLTRNPRRVQSGLPHCIFSRGGSDFAVPVGFSGQVIVGGPARPVPGAPPFVLGLLEADGGVFPLIEIDSWFNLAAAGYEPDSQVLLIEVNDFRVGIVVDRVREVRPVEEGEIGPALDAQVGGGLVRGLWQGPAREVSILDAACLVDQVMAHHQRMPEWQRLPKEDPSKRRQTEGREEFCIFTRGDRDLALPTAAAREMLGEEAATPVPQAPSHLSGVLNLRGDLLPLVRIDSWLGQPERQAGTGEQIVVVESGDVLVGIVVDRVRDVRGIDLKEIESYRGPAESDGIVRGIWRGDGQQIIILDARRLVEAAVDAVTKGFRSTQAGSGAISAGSNTAAES